MKISKNILLNTLCFHAHALEIIIYHNNEFYIFFKSLWLIMEQWKYVIYTNIHHYMLNLPRFLDTGTE